MGANYIIHDMSNEEYHSRPEISKSDLDKIAMSPRHYEYAKENPKRPTPAMQLGSLFHTLVLQPHLFHSQYCVAIDKPDCRTKDGKFQWSEFLLTVGDRILVEPELVAQANAMAAAVYANNTASALLAKSTIESSAFSYDNETGIAVKCRPDAAWPSHILIDLKSTEDASYNAFRKSIVTYSYDVQAAHYLETYSKASGVEYKTFVFIVCEKNPPYGVAVYAVNDAVVEAGASLRRKLLNKYSVYLSSDKKDIYPDEIQSIDMAAYGFDVEGRR